MDDADNPASQTKDARTQSQKAADEIARLTALKAEWEKFESPEERKQRRVRQAHILGEALLRLKAHVPANWHATMLEVALEHTIAESEKSEDKEAKDDQQTTEEWLVIREQLKADGWEFKKNSQGEERLHLPSND